MRGPGIVVGAALALSTHAAIAANLVYEEAGFLAEARGVVVETFEDEPNSGTPGAGGVTSIVFDGFTATASLPALKIFDSPQFGHDNTTPGGAKYLAVDTDLGSVSASVELAFDPPVHAVGFYLIGTDPGPSTVVLDGVAYPVAATGFDGNGYLGVLSNAPFTTLSITPDAVDSFWSLDDVALGLDPSPQRFDVFFDPASFLAAAGATSVEDFEAAPPSGTPGGGALSAIAFDAFTASSVPAAVKVLDAPLLGAHNTTPGGARYLAFDTDLGNTGSVGTLTFDVPVAGVGFVLVDVDRIDLVAGEVTVTVPGFEYPIAPTLSGGETFFAVLADPPLGAIEISPDAFDSLWNLDDVAFVPGPVVPTLSPPAFAAMIALLAAMGFVMLRRHARRGAE
jgi:hypothetical protein